MIYTYVASVITFTYYVNYDSCTLTFYCVASYVLVYNNFCITATMVMVLSYVTMIFNIAQTKLSTYCIAGNFRGTRFLRILFYPRKLKSSNFCLLKREYGK